MEGNEKDSSEDLENLLLRPVTLKDRQANAIERRALEVHAAMLRAWGSRDDGDLPTWDDAIAQAGEEIVTLCRALGELAEYRASEVFPRPGRRFRRPPPDH